MINITPQYSERSSPERVLQQRLLQLPEQSGVEDSFVVEFIFQQYFLAGSPELELLAMYKLVRDGDGVQIFAAVTDQIEQARQLLQSGQDIQSLAKQLHIPLMDLAAPTRLKTVAIPKPWGQEIWYTGIEERGQSLVTDGEFDTPLSWWLALAGQRLAAGKQQSVNLLKILDPLPEEVYGDLYFELHEEKREVYVVTHVDSGAWPAGEGAIRFGLNQQLRQQYADDDSFLAAYLDAVRSYEVVRRQIDGIFDARRQQQGITLDAPVTADQLKAWHSELPADLQQQEFALREAMNHFTAIKPLQVGDVVKVPCLTPHALQHGVRTVEFQTPVYERKILSFAQKVLTQGHWDTEDAARLMSLEKPEEGPLSVVETGEGYKLESVVNFDDFQVFRLTLAVGCQWCVPVTGDYGLLMCIDGQANCADMPLGEEQAVFLPAQRENIIIGNSGSEAAVLLLAQPR